MELEMSLGIGVRGEEGFIVSLFNVNVYILSSI